MITEATAWKDTTPFWIESAVLVRRRKAVEGVVGESDGGDSADDVTGDTVELPTIVVGVVVNLPKLGE